MEENGKQRVVGVAILPKKAEKHLHSKLLAHALKAGIVVKRIDMDRPLAEQGTFDLILHKIRQNKAFEAQLAEYQHAHPTVKVLDSVEAIQPLFNRATMLQPVLGDAIRVQVPEELLESSPSTSVCCCAPRQAILEEGCSLQQAHAAFAGKAMSYPLVVKTMWSDGTEYCHSVGVVYNEAGLRALLDGGVPGGLHLPLLFQQYEQHGGTLFKVYVLGRRVVMVKRDSLDIPEGKVAAEDGSGLQLLTRISAYPSAKWGNTDTTRGPSGVPDPPLWIVEAIARELSARLRLQMFNFDLICPLRQLQEGPPQLYVLDINYFPGYEKLPGYEELMVEFLLNQLEDKNQLHCLTKPASLANAS